MILAASLMISVGPRLGASSWPALGSQITVDGIALLLALG